MTKVPTTPPVGKITVSVDGGPEVKIGEVGLGPAARKVVTSEPKTLEEAIGNAEALVKESKRRQAAGDAAANFDEDRAIETIRELDLRVFTNKGQLKALEEIVDDLRKGHTAYNEMLKAKQAFETAKEKLRVALLSDGDYNDAMENLASKKQEIADDKDTLSTYIVEYYAATHEKQVEIGEDGNARDIVVTGRLGASGKYQTNLFSSAKNGEVKEQGELL